MSVQRAFVAAMVTLAAAWLACGGREEGAPCKTDFECTSGQRCDLATSTCAAAPAAGPDASQGNPPGPDADTSAPPDAAAPDDGGVPPDASQAGPDAGSADTGPAPTVRATGLADYIINQSAFRTVPTMAYGFAAESSQSTVKCKLIDGSYCLVAGYPYGIEVRSMNAGTATFVDRSGASFAALPYDASRLLYPMLEKTGGIIPTDGFFKIAGFGNIPAFSTPPNVFPGSPQISIPNVTLSTPPTVSRFQGFTVAWSTTGALKEVRIALSEVDVNTGAELQTVFVTAADTGQFFFNTTLMQNFTSGRGLVRVDRIGAATVNSLASPPGTRITYLIASARGAVNFK